MTGGSSVAEAETLWDAQFWVVIAGQGVLALGFLYLTYHLPAMYRDWVKSREAERKFLADERDADRTARHKQSSDYTALLIQTWNENQKTIDKIVAANEKREGMLLERLERVCRYDDRQQKRTPPSEGLT